MDENNVVEQEVKSVKKYNNVVIFLLILVFGILLGVLLMKFIVVKSNDLNVSKDFTVYVNQEKQVFRDKDGKRLYPIVKNGKVYLPINELGSYLGYMTIRNEEGLYLYNIENTGEFIVEGFSTTDYDGNVVDSSIFSQAKYNMFFIWATWCPDCKKQISELEKMGSYFKDNNIQIFSLVVDNYEKTKDNESKNMTSNIRVDKYLYADSVLMQKLIGNSVWIPKIVVVDNEGRLVQIFEDNLSSEELVLFFDNILNEI